MGFRVFTIPLKLYVNMSVSTCIWDEGHGMTENASIMTV